MVTGTSSSNTKPSLPTITLTHGETIKPDLVECLEDLVTSDDSVDKPSVEVIIDDAAVSIAKT